MVAVADDGDLLLQPGMAAQYRRKQDTALLVRRDLLGGGEQKALNIPAFGHALGSEGGGQLFKLALGKGHKAAVQPDKDRDS